MCARVLAVVTSAQTRSEFEVPCKPAFGSAKQIPRGSYKWIHCCRIPLKPIAHDCVQLWGSISKPTPLLGPRSPCKLLMSCFADSDCAHKTCGMKDINYNLKSLLQYLWYVTFFFPVSCSVSLIQVHCGLILVKNRL